MNVSAHESIFIQATPEAVWDYTQDWTRRTEWDPAISRAEIVPGEARVVRAWSFGSSFLVRYKQVNRPVRTSLAMSESTSRLFDGGGGSWDYKAEDGGTRLTQNNTLVVRNRLVAALFGWAFRWQLRRLTRQALRNAKRIIEGQRAASTT